MTIDPGIGGTGIAIWSPNGECVRSETFDSREKDWINASKHISRYFYQIGPFKFIAFEMPSNFQTSTASIAAGKRGDILKLSILIGMIIKVTENATDLHVPILVQTWKGNAKKEMMNDRVKRVFNNDEDQKYYLVEKMTTHALDAIGIGLYLQGKL